MATKLPSIPDPGHDPTRALKAVCETAQVREGLRGDPLDAFVSLRNLRQYIVSDPTIVTYLGLAHDHTVEHITPIDTARVLGRGTAGAGDTEKLVLSSDYGLTFTFTASSLKINTSQNLQAAASPTFVTVKLSGLTDGYVPYHVSDGAGLDNSPMQVSGVNVGIGKVPTTTLDVNGSVVANVKVGCVLPDASGIAMLQSYITGQINCVMVSNFTGIDWNGVSTGRAAVLTLGHATPLDLGSDSKVAVSILESGYVGVGTQAPIARLEIEDNGTAASMITKITADDAIPFGLVIGNDTYSTTDTNGLRFGVSDAGDPTISWTGTNFYLGTSGDLDAFKFVGGDLLITAGTISCSDLTDGYIPYHVSDTAGLANSVLQANATGVGIGAAPAADRALFMQPVSTLVGTTQYGIMLRPIYSSGATTAGTCIEVLPYLANAAFTMTDAYGIYIKPASKIGGTATLTNNYGIYIENINGGSTLNYSIYSAGGLNYFAGGVTTPSVGGVDLALNVTSGGTGALQIGGTASIKWDSSKIYPDVDNTHSCGIAVRRWKDGYFSTAVNVGTGATPETVILPTGSSYFGSNLGILTSAPVCRLEVEDAATAASMLVKITCDDQNPYGLIIGNDTYSTTDTNGLLFKVTDAGVAIIDWTGASLTLGSGAAGVDYILKFDGENNDGLLTWMEDEAEFKFSHRLDSTAGGLRTKVATTNVTAVPTDAELDTAFGTPATVGAGFIGVVNDNNAGTAIYLAISDGTNWHWLLATKAT